MILHNLSEWCEGESYVAGVCAFDLMVEKCSGACLTWRIFTCFQFIFSHQFFLFLKKEKILACTVLVIILAFSCGLKNKAFSPDFHFHSNRFRIVT